MFHDFLVTNKKVWEDGFVITSKRICPIVRTVGRITDRKWPRPWHVSVSTRTMEEEKSHWLYGMMTVL